MSRAVFALALVVGGLAWLTGASYPVRPPAEVALNDNLRPAGRLSRGVLTASLEIWTAKWHPLGPAKPGTLFGRRVLRVVQEP